MLHTYNPNQCLYQVGTSYTLQFLRYSTDNILKNKVTTARSNHYHTMLLHNYIPNVTLPSINLLHLTGYSPDKIFKLKVTTARSNIKSRLHHDIAQLHYTTPPPPQPMSHKVSTSYTFMFLRYKLFPVRLSGHRG